MGEPVPRGMPRAGMFLAGKLVLRYANGGARGPEKRGSRCDRQVAHYSRIGTYEQREDARVSNGELCYKAAEIYCQHTA